MAKQLPDRYYPTNPPVEFESWSRWIDEELHRIESALNANPVAMAVEGGGTINISPVPEYIPLGIGDSPLLDYPSGSWDPGTGIWTCPQDGTYLVNAAATVEPFGTGNKAYYCEVRLFVDDVEKAQQVGSGIDDVPVSVNLSVPQVIRNPSEVRFDLGAIHEIFTGTSLYTYKLSILRVSS